MNSLGATIPGRWALVLHGHIPSVLGHGTWPHGEDWLYEAAAACYLPMVESLDRLDEAGVPVRLTLGVTPVLAAQLADPRFHVGLLDYLDHRSRAGRMDGVRHRDSGDVAETRLAARWQARFARLRRTYLERCGGDLLATFRQLAERGQVEIMSSAATHGYLPLLPSEASVRAQVALGIATTRRLLGVEPRSFWMPECAYRPAGLWFPPWGGRSFRRAPVESFLDEAGIRATIVDSHLIGAERAPSIYGGEGLAPWQKERTPLRPYAIGRSGVRILAREPEVSLYVWSGQFGYPGDPRYLEFHKKAEEGLRYWRVTDLQKGLGEKELYDPAAAARAVEENSLHFVSMLRRRMEEGREIRPEPVVMTPFDAELFGHWWHEGWLFVERVFERLQEEGITASFASDAVNADPRPEALRLPEGSWGEGGDHRVWWNTGTRPYWERLADVEQRLKELARDAAGRLPRELERALVRQLVVLQGSDWPFSIYTGTSEDYAWERIGTHASSVEELIEMGRRALDSGELSPQDVRRLAELGGRDPLFHDDDLPPISNWAEPRRPSLEVLDRPMRIAMLAAECAPVAKVGGLADVVGALPRALRRAGCDVKVLVPLHGSIDQSRWGLDRLAVREGVCLETGEGFRLRALEAGAAGRIDFVELPERGRRAVYGGVDEFERYVAFCRAALQALVDDGFSPDIIHLHDWHTAPALALLNAGVLGGALGHPGTVFTIHNLAHQGDVATERWIEAGLPAEDVAPMGAFEWHGGANSLKGAVVRADRLTTVSPRYAGEIASDPTFGHGLEELLHSRLDELMGILNGIDVEVWNPSRDPHLPVPFDRSDPVGKEASRRALLDRIGLPEPRGPVFGSVSRLAAQKGIDRILEVLPRLLEEPGAFVFLGSGDPDLERQLQEAQQRWPRRVAYTRAFDDPLAHLIEAGSDFFLMPSRWEPCGLNQMYSLRYGTIPIVRETGGLADTVIDVDDYPSRGNGFSYRPDSGEALLGAVGRARRMWRHPAALAAMRRRGMSVDFSWDRAAIRYEAVYQEALETARWS